MEWNVLDAAAVLLVLTAVLSYFNHHALKLPATIGLLVSGLAASLFLLAADAAFPGAGLGTTVRSLVQGIDFHELLMRGMLGFLLFAGALHIDLEDLLARKWSILSLASLGVAVSTAAVGFGSYAVFRLLGFEVPLLYALVFGALISPTDPIAVLGMLKSVGAPKNLEIKITGESLFNDGVGVVLFTALLSVAASGAGGGEAAHAAGGEPAALGAVAGLFAREVAGGLALGFALGYAAYRAMRTLDDPNLEILISFALVLGITFAALRTHVSAPLGCVVAGLFIGNHGRRFAMSERTRQALDYVWSFIDHTLNAVLFLLLGLEVVALPFRSAYFALAALLIPLVLAARFASVGLPITLLRPWRDFQRGTILILTWGGLRGGISVALALSLPDFPGREAVLSATYAVVVFSVLVQGLTLGPAVRRLVRPLSAPLA